MSYRVRSIGRPIFRNIDLLCEQCGFEQEYSVDLRDAETEAERELRMNPEILCPNCQERDLVRIWKSAPSIGKIGADGSDTAIAAMKKSFNERFAKKELDDVRHKHGKAFDDSIRGGAVERIKKEKGIL